MPAGNGGTCRCTPSYEAWTYAKRDGNRIRKTFSGKGAPAEAKGRRSDAQSAVRKGTMKTPTAITVREAAESWLELSRTGAVRNRLSEAPETSRVSSDGVGGRGECPRWSPRHVTR